MELLASREFIVGALSAGIPLVLGFLVWLFRNQFGLFRRKVYWKQLTQFSDNTTVEVEGKSLRTNWTYVLLRISPGAEPVRDLKVFSNVNVIAFTISPGVPNTKLVRGEGDKSHLEIERIEAGSYQILIVSEGYGMSWNSVSGVSSENAKCLERSVPKTEIKSFWSLLPNRMAWLLVWSIAFQGIGKFFGWFPE